MQSERLGKRRRNTLNVNSEIAANYFTVRHQLIHHGVRHVDWNGKADSLIAAAISGQYRSIDTDQIAVKIDQRTAGISVIDGRISLNEIFIPFDRAAEAAIRRADDSHRGCFAYTKWGADREHHISHLNFR